MSDLDCSICGSGPLEQLSLSIYYCKRCHICYNVGYEQARYSSDYFFEEYRTQYGRSYEDDFLNIYKSSQKRLQRILYYLDTQPENLRLLDIGAAMGYFLKCAHDMGIHEFKGIEISPFACEQCISQFGFSLECISLDALPMLPRSNVVTAWFSIEHTINPIHTIRKIYSSLDRNGIFACALPSLRGPQFMMHRKEWLITHPKDHRIDFSPTSIKKILLDMGFSKIFIHPASYHPERLFSDMFTSMKSIQWLYRKLADTFAYGDTMEVYAIK